MTMKASEFAAILERRIDDPEGADRGGYAIALALLHLAEAIEDASNYTGIRIGDVAESIEGITAAYKQRN